MISDKALSVAFAVFLTLCFALLLYITICHPDFNLMHAVRPQPTIPSGRQTVTFEDQKQLRVSKVEIKKPPTKKSDTESDNLEYWQTLLTDSIDRQYWQFSVNLIRLGACLEIFAQFNSTGVINALNLECVEFGMRRIGSEIISILFVLLID